MLKKLRLKMILVTMSIVVAMLIVIFGLVYYFTQNDLQLQAESAMDTVALATEQPAFPGSRNVDVDLPYFVLQIDIWGGVTASGNTHYDLEDREFVQDLILQVYETNAQSGLLESYGLQYKILSGRGAQSMIFVDISVHDQVLSALFRSSFAIGVFSFAVFLVLSILLARWAVKPVDRAWQQQKQFVSDASHELKTPLTVIISNAELLLGQDSLLEEESRFAENILSSSRKMRNLTEGLLELSRADNGQVKKNFTELSLSRLAEEAVMPFEPVMFEQGMELRSRIESGITCLGNELYLRQVVDILLDNARKYSAPGIVALELKRTGRTTCLLTVANPGEPIPKEEQERIFDRFYRSDKARTQNGSFGLGLSIAKSVVQEHGGRIWVESNRTGNRFCVELPVKNQKIVMENSKT